MDQGIFGWHLHGLPGGPASLVGETAGIIP